MNVNKKDDKIALQSFLPYQITLLADLIARRTAAIARAQGELNLSQWRVIAAVAEKPGRTANDVVAITPMDKGIVSRAVTALLESGLLERRASQQDGRVSHLYLTARGEQIFASIAAEVRKVENDLNSALTPADRERLGSMLSSMMAVLG